MPLIKTTPADKYFSLCVRERADWTCERCQKQYPKGARGLHCSHIFSRRHKTTRHDGNNAAAHCHGCHQYLGSNPILFADWARSHLGSARFEMLTERHRGIVKWTRSLEREIAEHYKVEWEKLMQRRYAGETGRLEFLSFW